jgi:putative phosphoesterase
MLLGVIADSHDHLTHLRKAIQAIEGRGAEAILHAGDFVAPFAIRELVKARVPVHAVFGNNDGERKGIGQILPSVNPATLSLVLGGRKVILDHYPDVVERTTAQKPDIVVFGHTHQILIRPGPPLVVNPGNAADG